jgi:NAD(P)H dehydrogenase (quinone)
MLTSSQRRSGSDLGIVVVMNVLWVLAHPEQRSLNAALHSDGVAALIEAGHQVEVSDLYAMKWNPVVDREDYESGAERLHVSRASKRAFDDGSLSPEVRAEQAKLDSADLLVLQFPLWWFSVPAILKGWIDRVFVRGFAYGIPDPDHPGRNLRYGTGGLAGKRALVIATVGGAAESYGPRGLDGDLEQVLFPLLHGTFFYTGMSPMPPIAVHSADHLSTEDYEAISAELRARLATVETDAPIPYRAARSGDYDDNEVLRPDIAAGRTGLDVHR